MARNFRWSSALAAQVSCKPELSAGVPYKLTLISICGAISLGSLTLAAQAIPSAWMTNSSSARELLATERIAYRRCWKREGKRICQWVKRRRAIAQRKLDENNLPPNLGPALAQACRRSYSTRRPDNSQPITKRPKDC